MKRTIMTMAAFAIAMSFASCSKENTVTSDYVKEGEATYMSLSFSVPSVAKTRATSDENANEDETKFTNVDVFIFNTSGDQVNYKHFNAGEFTFSSNGTGVGNGSDIYSSTTKIATTTGPKKIIVGVNLTSDILAKLENKSMSAFMTIAQEVTVSSITGANGFAMFSVSPEEVTLVKPEAPDYGDNNHPTVQVQRLVAKVAVQKHADLDNNTIAAGTVADLAFELNNTNKKTYYVQPSNKQDHNWASTPDYDNAITTDPDGLYKMNDTYQSVDNAGVDAGLLHAKYCLENTTKNYLMGEITRVTVRGTFVPEYVKEYFSGTDNTNGYKDVKVVAGTTPATFYSVVYNSGADRAYFFDKNVADDFIFDNVGNIVEYKDGYCYWDIFLNPNGSGPYDVIRNDYYLCTITKIVGPGRATPEVTDPTVPPTATTDITVQIEMLYWNPIHGDFELLP